MLIEKISIEACEINGAFQVQIGDVIVYETLEQKKLRSYLKKLKQINPETIFVLEFSSVYLDEFIDEMHSFMEKLQWKI